MFNYLSWLNIVFSRNESLTDEPKSQPIKFTWKVRLSILGIFFLSGAVGLVYEIVWNRMLTVVFGSTVFAVTTVLTAFMAGMALGSFYIGRYADKHQNPLKIYAYLEIGIGIYALILPLILAGTNFIYIFLYRNLGGSFYILSIFRFILCFIVLLIPTTFMGGTLPVMTKAITGKIDRLGWTVGSLYALNTFGAVIGCFLAGFVLIKVMGITITTIISAVINFIIALIVLFIFAKKEFVFSDENNHKVDKKQDDNVSIELPQNAGKIALLVFGVSGFCALAYEVLWTRILVLFLGSTAYAFATMLSTFLFGIAIGSILIAKFADQRKDLLALLGIIQIIIALSAILFIPTYGKLYDIGLKFKSTGWWTFFISRYSLSFLVMLIPTIFMGATFPVASKIYANSIENLGKSIGKIYSINTLGSIFGSFFAGFVFIPLIGVQKSILVMACLNVAVGISAFIPNLIYWRSKNNSKKVIGHYAYIAVAIIAVIISIFVIDTSQPLTKFTAVFKGSGEKNKLLFYKEEVDTAVTVVEDTEGVRRIFVDTNQAAEDSRWDLPSHNIIGHLPILLHPDPKNALVIGFGMGVTSYAITRYGVNVDAVEISPGVVSANSFFTKINHDILKEPLLKLVVEDGRNYTLTTDKKYDMISAGIIHPLVSTNSAGFYTKDFYELCKKRMTENGIMCQWVPLHRLPEEHFKTIIRTFKASFPHTTLWYKWTPDFIILIGTSQELSIDLQDFSKRMANPAVKADLERVNMDDPFALLDSFMMDERTIDAYVGDGRIHTDNRPMIEFFGPQMPNTSYQNLDGMRNFRTTILPYLTNFGKTSQEFDVLKRRIQQNFDGTQYAIQGHLYYIKGEYENALKKLLAGAYINPNDGNIKWFINHIEKQMGMSEQELLDRVKANSKDVDALIKLGTVYQNQGQIDKAIEQFKKAIEIDPNSMLAHSNLAYIYEAQGKLDDAIAEFKELLRIKPDFPQIHVALGLLYDSQGKIDDAIAEMKKAIQLDPKTTVAYINLGVLYRKKGMLDDAIGQFKKLLEMQPDTAVYHGVLGDLYREKGDFDKAETEFKLALKLDPSMEREPNFVASIALVYYGKGMFDEAEKEMNKAISLDPNNEMYKSLLAEIKKRKK